jgi:iron complex transport system substrate-binding protein
MVSQNPIARLLGLCLAIAMIAVALSACGTQQVKTGGNGSAAATRTIVDHAGRSVTVPTEINKVFSTSPVGMIMMYSLAPAKLVGWNFELMPENKKYILPEYQDLPILGGWYANTSCNTEELLKIHPDVIISIGDLNATTISQAESIQNQIGIPVVAVNSELTKMDQTYELLGDLIGEKDRAGELAAYCRQSVSDVVEKAKQIPQEKRLKVYYAEGTAGLETDPRGSQHTQVLDLVGGINVADVPMKGGMGLSTVSLEQILSWDPDVIITATMGGLGGKEGMIYKNVTTDPKWSKLQAVKNNRVYDIPDKPFNWFDRPPASNRIIGVRWLANVLYPDIFTYDIKAEMKDYYARFYHYDLTDQEVESLLARTGGKPS